eukprot:TRINITY_DN28020_c0_g1_i1.p1 TRINITY_DN28020_c0_g1~~TRINITY_DN28020_c0_g1_i1.p1  ORF type:complete len:257 (-),score=63.48 TRINITY_DN28020_c0_g1_i1:313-1026(-)
MAKHNFSEIASVGEHGAADADEVLFADVQVTVDGETFLESASALATGSPVLRAMLVSQMKEGVTKVIDLPGKSAAEYAIFRQFFRAHAAVGGSLLTVDNVDAMLPWFHEYQMSKMLHESGEILMKQPVTTERLVQACKYDLEAQYKRCLESVAERFTEMDITGLELHPKIVADLLPVLKKKTHLATQDSQKFKDAVRAQIQRLRSGLFHPQGTNGYKWDHADRAKPLLEEMRTNLGL